MTSNNPTYTVQWAMFTEAESPHDAVRIAIQELREMLRDTSKGANRFTVFSEEEGQEVVHYVNAGDVDPDDDIDVWKAFS